MKILVFPNKLRNNPYYRTFLAGLNTAGIEDVRLSTVLSFRSKFDAIHLHHPEHAVTQDGWLKSTILATALLSVAVYARLTGRPVVWMVHDVEPAWVRHKVLLVPFMKAINKLTSAHIFLNKSSRQFFSVKNPEEVLKPFCFAPHSRFDTTIAAASAVTEQRAAHGIGETDILISFLGSITPHKGLECVALLPSRTKSGRAVKLAVCGMVDHVLPPSYVDDLLGHKAGQGYIRLPNRLTDEELALWIQSSDAVFLPYRSGFNSGMALNILSNHGRIISSDLPMFQELAERCGPSWVRCVDLRSAAAIEEMVESLELWRAQERDFDRLEAILTEGDPVENGRKLSEFYRRLQRHQISLPV